MTASGARARRLSQPLLLHTLTPLLQKQPAAIATAAAAVPSAALQRCPAVA